MNGKWFALGEEVPVKLGGATFGRVFRILESARPTSDRSVDIALVASNWQMGREVMEEAWQ